MVQKCTECSSQEIFQDEVTGNSVCLECGLVVEEKSVIQPWKEYIIGHNGPITTYRKVGKGLGTQITRPPLKTQAKKFNLPKNSIREKKTKREKRLIRGLDWLRYLCIDLGISPEIEEEAARILSKANSERFVRKDKINIIATACLLFALRKHKMAIGFKELKKSSNIEKSRDSSYFWKIYHQLEEMERVRLKRISTKEYIFRYINHLEGETGNGEELLKIIGLSFDLLRNGNESNIFNGYTEATKACSVLYVACKILGKRITLEKLCKISHLSRNTIWKLKEKLVKNLDIDLKKKDQYPIPISRNF